MPNTTRGVGLFTAENNVAVIRAIPESDGTYRDVARKAEQYGGNFHYHTISNWVRYGQADVEAGQPYVQRYGAGFGRANAIQVIVNRKISRRWRDARAARGGAESFNWNDGFRNPQNEA